MADMYPNKTEERKAALESLTSDTFPYPLLFTVFVMDRGYRALPDELVCKRIPAGS